MSRTLIKVENLSKLYRLGEVGTGTVSHDLNRWIAKVRGKEDPFALVGQINDRTKKAESDYVWALKDINFDVKQGEVVGIIGKNGAGKSTLLKLLSQITTPTTGEIKVKGRIAALLEVGTGMHPEMTARENIYLNGAILGMRKHEIKSKFDEIIDFAGCAMYVDTPIKRFSSGMRVRLGFAVAAFLEPEILIVDEVLAVGDAEFQKKAIGKMKEVSEEGGRTVLFVSHNMASVKTLCNRGIVLNNGGISFMGSTDESISKYLKEGSIDGNTEYKIFEDQREMITEEVDLISIGIKAEKKEFGQVMRMDENLELVIKFNKKDNQSRIDTTIQVKDASGNFLFISGSGSKITESNQDLVGVIEQRVSFPKNFFNAAEFYVNLLVVKNRKSTIIKLNDVISFNIINKEQELGTWMGRSVAPLLPDFNWDLIKTKK